MSEKARILCFLNDIALPYKAKLFISQKYSISDLVEIERCKNEVIENLGESVYYKLKNANILENIEKSVAVCQKSQINIVSYLDDNYPKQLRNLQDKPLLLHQG